MNKHSAPVGPDAFANPDSLPGALSARVAATLLAAAGDVTLVLDADGTVLDLAMSDRDLARFGVAGWAGRPWIDTVTPESREKVEEMLAEAATGTPARWRQINHVTGAGELPVRYLVTALGEGGRLVAIGHDLRSAAVVQQRLLQAQQSLERDYLRLRQAESRYRLLFDMAQEPVLIVDATTRRIREANPAAHRVIGARDGALIDQLASSIVDAQDRETFVAHLGAVEATDDLPPLELRLAKGRGAVQISARLFRQARVALLLLRLKPVEQEAPAVHDAADARLSALVEGMPDCFVVTDADGAILAANPAFVEMVEAPSPDRVKGAPLANWLGRPGIDLDLIVGQLREHGSVRNVATIVRAISGAQEEVEVSGVTVADTAGTCYGFTIRSVARRLHGVPDQGADVPRSVEQLTELVGRMSLKDIVRESTDLIERLCIEAALNYTSDNRASAAEILGLSRQSLYSKMHRHGLGSLTGGA